ncbi:hypothetical protein OAL53_02235 [Akkermansiaceae bacterium]|nr:hypothetical protein [Akkermansiaceae bacterium]MDA7621724.1 hypothetical protein [bacterium]MDA7515814.1 hypothetical protein [Akkermansiaceae bacterium]MDA7517167.1 hypothetical protein [Akkermansiaceae bacterium]MDA7643394.1 hypothetical protein [Akkermansiaceae bacterium]
MKFSLFALVGLLLSTAAHAQWQSTTYTLKGGWNSIYLHGDASHASPDALFELHPDVLEVWRWNPNPNQVQFTSTPLLPSAGTPEWSKWVRGTAGNSLTGLTGQSAYLIKCSGTTASSYALPIAYKPMPPQNTWVRSGANFLGFPSNKRSGDFPTFSEYFSTFPAAIASNVRIFKYDGGELGATNPRQVFSTSQERLDRDQAYWFSSEVVGNFYAPVQIALSNNEGLSFGRRGSVITARVMNRTASVMTLTIAPVASDLEPSGQESITGPVPLTRRIFNEQGVWVETAISAAYDEVIAPNSSVELSFGIDRSLMGEAAEALYASLLRFTDSANTFDILIPATARKSSLAGLWIGDALVTAVESKRQEGAVKPAGRAFPLRYLIHVADDGTARVLSQIFMGPMAAEPHNIGLCLSEASLKADAKSFASRFVATHMPLDLALGTTGSFAIGGNLACAISTPFNDPTNPFVHQYHPDHDNKGASAPLEAGKESYNITRQVTFTFTSTPTSGGSATGWGSSVIGGNYGEVVSGLHRDSVGVGDGDGLQLSGTFELRRASELGTLNP